MYFLLFFFIILNFTFKDFLYLDYLNRRIYSFDRGLNSILFSPFKYYYLKILPNFIINDININNYSILYQNFIFILFLKSNYLNFNNLLKSNFFFIKFGNFNDLHFKKLFFDLTYDKYKLKYMYLPFVGPNNYLSILNLIFIEIFNPYLYLSDNLFIYYFFKIIYKKIELGIDIDFFHKNVFDGYSFIKDLFIQSIK